LTVCLLAEDCDARVEHLKKCDPMIPGFMDYKMMKGRRARFGGANEAEVVPLASMAAKRGRKPEKLRRNSKKGSKVAT
jgi:hypothetical protein